MAIKEHSDGGPAGNRLGQSSTDLIAFHGATPSDQRAHTAAVSASVAITGTSAGAFGFTETQANAIVTLVNECRAILVEKGLMAAS